MANDTTRPNNKQSIDNLKTSGFERRMSIAKTSLNIGRRWAGNSVSGMFLDKKARSARNQVFMEAQANYVAQELGKLKGSVVKIGQMLAMYGEHVLPPEITRALQTLNDDTATLAWPKIEQTLRRTLGDKLDELEVNPIPIGTASLAQVHRATIIATGEDVVLKIQYPGVADAIDSDLALFKRLLKAVMQCRKRARSILGLKRFVICCMSRLIILLRRQLLSVFTNVCKMMSVMSYRRLTVTTLANICYA